MTAERTRHLLAVSCMVLLLGACAKPSPSPTQGSTPTAQETVQETAQEKVQEKVQEKMTEPATPASSPEPPETVGPKHVVFIGKPKDVRPIDCAGWDADDAPHRRHPPPVHDRTVFPERYHAFVEVLEVLQGPDPKKQVGPPSWRGAGDVVKATVAFALGNEAFRTEEFTRADADAYDRGFCARVNALFASEFVVVHAYAVYVDHGNGPGDFWSDLGTDMRKANAGFATLDEARAYAKTLVDVTP